MITMFAANFAPRRSVTYERYTFMKRVQNACQSFDTFVTDLRNIIGTCEYHVDEHDNLLRDQIVLGITSDAVREKLVYADGSETKLTLLIGLDICRNSETTRQLLQNVSVDTSNVVLVPVHALTRKQGNAKPNNSEDKIKFGAILWFSLKHVTQSASSIAMENDGCFEVLTSLEDHGLDIKVLGSDHCPRVAKLMKQQFPQINHQCDL